MAVSQIISEFPASCDSPIRVLIVDDSVVVRSLLQRWFAAHADIELVGSVGDGQKALQTLERKAVDVVILDIAMPVMDGLTALPKIRQLQPLTQIIISSTLTTQNAEISIRALEQGAADYVTKPSGKAVVLKGQDFFDSLLRKVMALGRAAQKKRSTTKAERPSAPIAHAETKAAPAAKPFQGAQTRKLKVPPHIMAIGCSTGGPQALFRLLDALPKPFALPILIVQHMPPLFTDILAQQLTRSTGIETCEAKNGQVIFPGKAYVAPGDFHMLVRKDGGLFRIALNQHPPVNYCRPAVNPLFESVATQFGAHALAVVLTGMGKDGLTGAREIAAQQGTILVQDEASSVVWGMPGAIATAGLADEILPLDQLAAAIAGRVVGASA